MIYNSRKVGARILSSANSEQKNLVMNKYEIEFEKNLLRPNHPIPRSRTSPPPKTTQTINIPNTFFIFFIFLSFLILGVGTGRPSLKKKREEEMK